MENNQKGYWYSPVRTEEYYDELKCKYPRACLRCGCELSTDSKEIYCDDCKADVKNGREMILNDQEIMSLYRTAARKEEELDVLADLNLCTREQMAAYLIRLGISDEYTRAALEITDSKESKSMRRLNAQGMELYKRGLTDRAISIQLKVSTGTIRKWRRQNGLETVKAEDDRKRRAIIDKLLAQGIPPKKIAEEIGVSPEAIRRRRRIMQKRKAEVAKHDADAGQKS